MAFVPSLSISLSKYSLFVSIIGSLVIKIFNFFLYQNYYILYSCLRTSLMSCYNDVFGGFQLCSISCIKFHEYCFFYFYQLFRDFLRFIIFLNARLMPVLEQLHCSMLILISFSIVINLPNLLILGPSEILFGFCDFMCQVFLSYHFKIQENLFSLIFRYYSCVLNQVGKPIGSDLISYLITCIHI